MADHSKPTTSSTYSNFVTELSDRVNEIVKGMDPATTSPTNVPTNAIRWTSASNKWQKWNGTAWADLSSGYALPISGVSVAATTLSASSTVSGTGFATYLASPPAIGGTTPAAGSFTTLTSTGALTVATDCIKTDATNKTVSFGYATTTSTARTRSLGLGTTNATSSWRCYDSASALTFEVQDDGLIQTASSSSGKTGAPYNSGTPSATPKVAYVNSSGTFQTYDAYANTTVSSANVFVSTGGLVYRATSSRRYKTDIAPLSAGLAATLAMQPVTFRANAADDPKTYGGLIAEDVEAIDGMEPFIDRGADGSTEGLHYGHMVAVLVNAIKEQHAHITALETRISALEAG